MTIKNTKNSKNNHNRNDNNNNNNNSSSRYSYRRPSKFLIKEGPRICIYIFKICKNEH